MMENRARNSISFQQKQPILIYGIKVEKEPLKWELFENHAMLWDVEDFAFK